MSPDAWRVAADYVMETVPLATQIEELRDPLTWGLATSNRRAKFLRRRFPHVPSARVRAEQTLDNWFLATGTLTEFIEGVTLGGWGGMAVFTAGYVTAFSHSMLVAFYRFLGDAPPGRMIPAGFRVTEFGGSIRVPKEF